MLDRVFCNARDIARPASPETVKAENTEAKPLRVRTHAAANATQRILITGRTSRTASREAPALLAALVMALVSSSPTSQETPTIPTASAANTIVAKSTNRLQPKERMMES